MIACQGQAQRQIRSLFVSDVHLGCRHACAAEFLDFLQSHEPEYLYLVGDIIDGWKLRRNWRWLGEYDAIIRRLMELSCRGTLLYYTPGNHDAFLRNFEFGHVDLGFIEIADEFVHETNDGRQLLVMHGDQFDRVENEMRWLSAPVTFGYDLLLTANRLFNQLRGGKAGRNYAFSAAIKARVKQLVSYISDFEDVLSEQARSRAFEGVICGHIHKPAILCGDDVTYYNTGDWVEHRTALAEYGDGTLELLCYEPDGSHRVLATDECKPFVERSRRENYDQFEDEEEPVAVG